MPIRVRDADRTAGPTAPFLGDVASDAVPALLAAFTRSLGVLHGGGVRAAALLGSLGHPASRIAVPAMPSSPDLCRVAESLLSDPSRSPAEVGADHGVGESVLARRFRAETGWTPLRWRTRHVLGKAAERLGEHGRVARAAADAGYGSPQAFARAFRREWGITPADAVAGAATASTQIRRAAELGPQCNGYHIVVWVAVGSAVIDVDGVSTTAHAGDVVCLPAGTSAGFRAGADSAVLPLGWLPGGSHVVDGVIARIGDDQRAPLLRLAAWAYAAVAPVVGGDPRIALQRMLGLPEPDGILPPVADAAFALLERLSEHPEDSRPLPELARQLGIPSVELRDAVETLTGTTLRTWRARTRMSVARRLLRDGVHASQVAGRVGYADAAAFSRAFRRAHGGPPSQFLAAQSRSPLP